MYIMCIFNIYTIIHPVLLCVYILCVYIIYTCRSPGSPGSPLAAYLYLYIYIYIYICTPPICAYTYMYIQRPVYIHIYMYLYMRIYKYKYIFIYRQSVSAVVTNSSQNPRSHTIVNNVLRLCLAVFCAILVKSQNSALVLSASAMVFWLFCHAAVSRTVFRNGSGSFVT